MDVEAVAVLRRLRQQGIAARGRNRRQHLVGGVCLVLVGEVDARDHTVEHPAREQCHVDVWRLRWSIVRAGHATGLDRVQLIGAVAVLDPVARETAKAVQRRRAA